MIQLKHIARLKLVGPLVRLPQMARLTQTLGRWIFCFSLVLNLVTVIAPTAFAGEKIHNRRAGVAEHRIEQRRRQYEKPLPLRFELSQFPDSIFQRPKSTCAEHLILTVFENPKLENTNIHLMEPASPPSPATWAIESGKMFFSPFLNRIHTQSDAIEYCKVHDAHLPTTEDFYELLKAGFASTFGKNLVFWMNGIGYGGYSNLGAAFDINTQQNVGHSFSNPDRRVQTLCILN
jgi:hypothetical protein